jgi:hypothetical protein
MLQLERAGLCNIHTPVQTVDTPTWPGRGCVTPSMRFPWWCKAPWGPTSQPFSMRASTRRHMSHTATALP